MQEITSKDYQTTYLHASSNFYFKRLVVMHRLKHLEPYFISSFFFRPLKEAFHTACLVHGMKFGEIEISSSPCPEKTQLQIYRLTIPESYSAP